MVCTFVLIVTSSLFVEQVSNPSISGSWGRIFSCVRPSYERAVSYLDRSMHISLWTSVAHNSFIEGSHTNKNTASESIVLPLRHKNLKTRESTSVAFLFIQKIDSYLKKMSKQKKSFKKIQISINIFYFFPIFNNLLKQGSSVRFHKTFFVEFYSNVNFLHLFVSFRSLSICPWRMSLCVLAMMYSRKLLTMLC